MPTETVALSDLGWQAWFTGVVVLAMLGALVRELASPAVVMVGGLVVLMLAGVVDTPSALAGFSNPAMLTVGALFIVAAAVRRTGALAFLRHLMMPTSDRVPAALARIMLPASFMSSFLNNTPIVAFLTPMIQQWARVARMPASKLLMPLSFATILGGMSTLIGTSTNLVVSSLLESRGLPGLAMFELAWVGVPAAVVGFVYFALVGHRLLPATDDQTESKERHRREYQFDLRVPQDSPLVGQTIEAAGLRHLEDAFLAHLVRRGELVGPSSPHQTLAADDILVFYGDTKRMERLIAAGRLARVIEVEEPTGELPHLPLYEVVVSAESSLVGKSLKEYGFRERFQAVALGIHRAGRRLRGPVGRVPIETGDLLLVEAGPNFEELWVQSGEFYFVAPLERDLRRVPGKANAVLAVLVAMMTSVAMGWLPAISAAFGAAMLVVLTRSISASEARRSVDVSVLMVIASAFGIGSAIQQTGLAGYLAGQLVGLSAGLGLVAVLALVYVFTNLLTEVLTNSVSAVLIFPIGMAIAANLGVDPRTVAVTIAVAASASFATPIGYQTNLMVMAPGGYRFGDYLRAGIPLNLLVLGLTLLIVPRIWPS